MIRREDYLVYLVTDDPSRYVGDFVESVEEAVSGGVTLVQYRDTESNRRVMYERALRLRDMLRVRKVPLIINDYADLALALEADGVHVGQSDMPAEAVRRIVGKNMTIGLSITNMKEAKAMPPHGVVDYVGIGPVFDATKTKADAAPEMGLDGFARIRRELADWPAVAIGGVTIERAPSIMAAGADGLAVVSAFSKAASPRDAARAISAQFRH